ncbi:hypothetical protein MSIMFB_01754 [Mycobacterium simulans]|uniref:Uncharacterized protein n=1 Tax=Mycobacterium simulans TaxID=627089 RepID=A0A7Z7IKZ3_9MYCO|nr:hypothetical protein MSIMFB_01754 [Mycobacterium simulans]
MGQRDHQLFRRRFPKHLKSELISEFRECTGHHALAREVIGSPRHPAAAGPTPITPDPCPHQKIAKLSSAACQTPPAHTAVAEPARNDVRIKYVVPQPNRTPPRGSPTRHRVPDSARPAAQCSWQTCRKSRSSNHRRNYPARHQYQTRYPGYQPSCLNADHIRTVTKRASVSVSSTDRESGASSIQPSTLNSAG